MTLHAFVQLSSTRNRRIRSFYKLDVIIPHQVEVEPRSTPLCLYLQFKRALHGGQWAQGISIDSKDTFGLDGNDNDSPRHNDTVAERTHPPKRL